VDLSYLEGELSISVSDNGKGLPQTKDLALKSSGLGLLGLSERFARLGGSVAVTSNRNVGTTLLAKVFWPIILFSQ
jgi:two-component system sensor histidine kinase UhpB